MVFIFLFSKPIMSLFGNDFIQGSVLLSLIVIGQLINVSMGSVGLMLQMTGLEKTNERYFNHHFINFIFIILCVNK